jgi:hypothetical protein
MDFTLHSVALKWAEELLSLLRAYEAANYDMVSMRDSALQFDEMDLARYAKTDQMPIRIRGQLYAVSEEAASSVVLTSMLMMQLMMWEGIRDPRSVAIRCIEYTLPPLRRGRTITISAVDRSDNVLITAAGSAGQEFPGFALMVFMLVLGISDFDPEQLADDKVRLIPI